MAEAGGAGEPFPSIQFQVGRHLAEMSVYGKWAAPSSAQSIVAPTQQAASPPKPLSQQPVPFLLQTPSA